MKKLIRTIVAIFLTPLLPGAAAIGWIAEDDATYKDCVVDHWNFLWNKEKWKEDLIKRLRGE